jgi:RimJ/RimL family protein N-acetyltransferase
VFHFRCAGKARKARLRDGTVVTLRPVRGTDIEALRSFLQGMSPESRYLRFHASVTDLSDAQWQYLVSADGRNHVAIVAWRGAVVVGVGRYIRLEGSPDKAEVAFAVTDALQRRGLGALLRDELVAAARRAGIRSFRAEVLAGNRGIRRLLRKASMSAVSDVDNVLEVALDQERPLPEPLVA